MTELLLIGGAAILAFSNGANDNFKGFATVWGADLLSYRQALALASVATALGSLTAIVLAESLLKQFTGKGLVPDAVAGHPGFIVSVGIGAAVTVLLATRIGLPISTTHALIGGLLGAGLAAGSGLLNFGQLWSAFLAPMLLSPLAAAVLGLGVYRLLARRRPERDCLCLTEAPDTVALAAACVIAARGVAPRILVASPIECEREVGAGPRISIAKSLDRIHILSAGAICFARGVNDTPKLAALLLAGQALDVATSVTAVGALMVVGGLLFARRVAETMSRRVVRLDHDQGVAANVISAGLILFASHLGVPVSTTHVSVGSIAGVGLGARKLDGGTLRTILLSWLATLPFAALFAYGAARWIV